MTADMLVPATPVSPLPRTPTPITRPPVAHPPVRYPIGGPPVYGPAPEPPPLSPTQIENSQPWLVQYDAAYTRLAGQLTRALGVFEQETAAAGRLLTLSQQLAGVVRGQLEGAAWAAYEAKMTAALGQAADIISPDLPQRDRGLTSAYNAMMQSAADAVADWHHWMALADSAAEAILNPAQQAYDTRMEQAYQAMMAANSAAQNGWRQMYDGAERAGTLLTNFKARSGPPAST